MQTRVLFDWDYGYRLPLRGLAHPSALLSAALVADLRRWLDVFEAGNPSDPSHPGEAWITQGRGLCTRVRGELGPSYEVAFVLDEPLRRYRWWGRVWRDKVSRCLCRRQ